MSIHNSNDKNIMSINVFKKHPANKITFSNRAILSGELKIMGYRPKVISVSYTHLTLPTKRIV